MNTQKEFDKQDDFTKGYIIAALWTSEEEANQDAFEVSNINKNVLSQVILDCKNFQEKNKELLTLAYEHNNNYDSSRAGHDFWLTRNGHGVGFWDRDLGEVGKKLSDIATNLKGSGLYIGDDNQLYFSNLPQDKKNKLSI
jgi:hypothetical protein